MTVYFDNSATTRVCTEAAETVVKLMTEDYGNPSSGHFLGRRAKAHLDEARKNVAYALGAKPEEIFFTSGGTESDNWAIFGAADLKRHNCHHMITSAYEHDAIRKPMERLASQGWDITYLQPDKFGRISAEQVTDALRDDTALVSIMLVNNEIGAINPISEIAKAVKSKNSNTLIHVDAVQGFCKIPFTAASLGADLITVSSHKIHGPKGVGALYIKNGMRFPPIIFGGGQEKSYRSGTEALPGICGFGTAAKIGRDLVSQTEKHTRELRDHLVKALNDISAEVLVIGEGDAPHILSISLPGYKSEVLMNVLDADGICVSKSSACKRGGRSHVLEVMGLPNDVIDGAIRISFSRMNTLEECDYFAEKLDAAAKRLIKVKR